MGREVRRVSKGFDWPLNKTWWGYLLEPIQCQSCTDGTNPNGAYGHCPVCEGEHEVYPKVNPPAVPALDFKDWMQNLYPAWQMWETTSEGSPISPPCGSPEELAEWLASNDASAFGSSTATKSEWLRMIQQGWSVSAVYTPERGLQSGVSEVQETPAQATEKE